MRASEHVGAIARRELRTVVRTPASWLLVAGVAVVVATLSTVGGGASGYLPVVVDRSTPSEALVPVFAFAFGYRVFLLLGLHTLVAGLRLLGFDVPHLFSLSVYQPLGYAVSVENTGPSCLRRTCAAVFRRLHQSAFGRRRGTECMCRHCDSRVTRRSVLSAAGAVGVAATAGCLGGNGAGSGDVPDPIALTGNKQLSLIHI